MEVPLKKEIELTERTKKKSIQPSLTLPFK